MEKGHPLSLHFISPMYFTIAQILPGSIFKQTNKQKTACIFDYCLLPLPTCNHLENLICFAHKYVCSISNRRNQHVFIEWMKE